MNTFPMPNNLIFIGGEWRKGRGDEIASHFSADMSLNCVINGASKSDGSEAVAAAKKAQEKPEWRDMKPTNVRIFYTR